MVTASPYLENRITILPPSIRATRPSAPR
jgi:hypothetical protein